MVSERTDLRVLKRIRHLVDMGIVAVGEIKRSLQDFVKNDILEMPSNKSILNAIYRYSR